LFFLASLVHAQQTVEAACQACALLRQNGDDKELNLSVYDAVSAAMLMARLL
jgi:hypothetical protein